MEEIKLLVELINTLPTLAVWALVLFFCYKIIIIGSVYGLIKFCVENMHNWLTAPRVVSHDLGSGVISDALPELPAQLSRIKNRGSNTNSPYIHTRDVRWLAKAIDAQEAADREAKK